MDKPASRRTNVKAATKPQANENVLARFKILNELVPLKTVARDVLIKCYCPMPPSFNHVWRSGKNGQQYINPVAKQAELDMLTWFEQAAPSLTIPTQTPLFYYFNLFLPGKPEKFYKFDLDGKIKFMQDVLFKFGTAGYGPEDYCPDDAAIIGFHAFKREMGDGWVEAGAPPEGFCIIELVTMPVDEYPLVPLIKRKRTGQRTGEAARKRAAKEAKQLLAPKVEIY